MTTLSALFFAAALAAPAPNTPVRATLSDGQVLMGAVKTRVLHLETGSGVLDVPLADIGEVVPVSDQGLGESRGLVNVWLRNGSELRGRWAEPELDMGIKVGGAEVPVDLPMNDLSRFQLQGGAAWPSGPVYRMRTTWGDDFLLDPTRTHLVMSNRLGTFAPALAECVSAAPTGDPTGEWRIVLKTGTVLLGKLDDAAVTVALPLGPKEITVPLENFVSLNLQTWSTVRETVAYADAPATLSVQSAEAAIAAPRRHPTAAAPRAQDEATNDGWFDAAGLDAAKDAAP